MNPSKTARPYYPALDGLRGVAILLVVFYHNFNFINYLFFGWLGVDLFFVLSGFLITDILLKTNEENHYLKKFFIRRILRIFPLYYLSLILFLILLPALFDLKGILDYYIQNQLWLWVFLQNWLYILKPPPYHTNFLNHYWSLAVEEQFYILWPFIILFLRKIKYLLIFISGVLVLVLIMRCIVWIYHIEDLSYFNLYTFSRIDGICIGCMVSLIRRQNINFLTKYSPHILFLFAGWNFLFYLFNSYYHFTFPYLALIGYTTLSMLFGLLINEAVIRENKVINFIFTLGILKFFGKISYSLYIFHWPIYVLCFSSIELMTIKYLPDSLYGNFHQYLSSLICTIIAIVISLLSYKYYEKYFLKLKSRFI